MGRHAGRGGSSQCPVSSEVGSGRGGPFAWRIQHLFDVMFWYFLTPTRDGDAAHWNELIMCISKQNTRKKRNTQRNTKNKTKKWKKKKKHRQADYLNEMILWIEKWPPGIWDKIKRVCLANQSEPNQTERTLPNWTVPQRSARPRQTRLPVCHRPSLWLVGSARNKTKILMHIPVCMCVCQCVCVACVVTNLFAGAHIEVTFSKACY